MSLYPITQRKMTASGLEKLNTTYVFLHLLFYNLTKKQPFLKKKKSPKNISLYNRTMCIVNVT